MRGILNRLWLPLISRMNFITKLIQKILNNPTIMSWSSYFVQFGSGLVVLPLILKKYGETDQAFWFLVGTIRGFAMLADVGFGFIIIRAVSFFFSGLKKLPKNLKEFENTKSHGGDPNFQGLSDLLSTIKVIYLLLSFIVLVLLGSLGIFTVWNLISIANHSPHLWLSYIFVALSSIVYIKTIMWQSYMNGLNYVAKVYRFSTLIGILRITIFTILLILNFGVEYLSFYILIDSILTYLYYRWFVNNWLAKNYKKCGQMRFKKEIFQSLWPITWKTGVTQWGDYFLNNGTAILGAQIQNVTLMASFLFTQRVFHLVRRTSEAPFYTHIPIIFRLMAKKDYGQLKKKAGTYIFFSMTLLIGTLSILGLFGNQILGIVRIDTDFVPLPLFLVMAITLLIQTHAGYHGNIYSSTNSIPYMIPTVISGLLLLGVGYMIVPVYELFGIVLLQLVIWIAFLAWYQVKISLKLLSWPLMVYIKDLFSNGFRFMYYQLSNLRKFGKK